MQQAIALAEAAMANGDHPFGALLVREGVVVLTAVNTINTHHAELNLVSQGACWERPFPTVVFSTLANYGWLKLRRQHQGPVEGHQGRPRQQPHPPPHIAAAQSDIGAGVIQTDAHQVAPQ